MGTVHAYGFLSGLEHLDSLSSLTSKRLGPLLLRPALRERRGGLLRLLLATSGAARTRRRFVQPHL